MRLWTEFFAAHPILLSPTWAMPAFEHMDMAWHLAQAVELRQRIRG